MLATVRPITALAMLGMLKPIAAATSTIEVFVNTDEMVSLEALTFFSGVLAPVKIEPYLRNCAARSYAFLE
ncbi:hypothetical protein D3C85_1733260 [compost metagenome]